MAKSQHSRLLRVTALLKKTVKKFLRQLVLLPVYFYRYTIKAFLPMSCRFAPSCSEYAIDAVNTLGPLKGTCKAILRILRCNPWCAGGYDPVLPNNKVKKETKKDDRF